MRKEQEKGKDKERVKSQLDEKTVKQLLGELYEDRDYLERLLHEEDEKNKRRQAISGSQNEQKEQKQARRGRAAEDEKPGLREAIISGLNYLDKRSEFWQQQVRAPAPAPAPNLFLRPLSSPLRYITNKRTLTHALCSRVLQRPMYARKRDQQRTMDDALAKGTPDSEARHVSNPPEYIVQRLEEIDERALRSARSQSPALPLPNGVEPIWANPQMPYCGANSSSVRMRCAVLCFALYWSVWYACSAESGRVGQVSEAREAHARGGRELQGEGPAQTARVLRRAAQLHRCVYCPARPGPLLPLAVPM